MKKTLSFLAFSLISATSMAQGPSFDEAQFCKDRQLSKYVKSLTNDAKNLMAFRNHGGLVNGGVCWWHSRFQRNALYLAIFKPNLPKPTEDEARDLIKQIRFAKNVVIVPGYSNFREFTYDFEALVQRELEKWQKGDGFIRMAWTKGLAGKSEVAPEKLKENMDAIYEEVEGRNNIAYNKLQIPGIDAHAWLVVGMKKRDTGYDLKVLDSNFPNVIDTFHYRDGDTYLNYHGIFKLVPYLERSNEMDNINEVVNKFCEK
jgi:hypothetical protein